MISLAGYSSPNQSAIDIPSPNKGEQAMIANLRSAIEQSHYLREQVLKKKIFIGAGISGCKAFQESFESGYNVLLTWQWLDEMENLAKGTIVVVPEHAINSIFKDNFKKLEEQCIKFITIDGVLHTRTLENIQNEDATLITASTELIVMLGGDTQQEDGKWVLYDETMANKLVSKIPIEKNTLILNGPRTGKYRNINGSNVIDETAHRTTIDYITQLVNNASIDKPWHIEDFNFSKNSLWGPVLKFCVNNPETILVLPGESTSMISEALTLGIKPVIHLHIAMTKTSAQYVLNMAEKSKVFLYSDIDLNSVLSQELYRQEAVPIQDGKIIQCLSEIMQYETSRQNLKSSILYK